MLAGVVFIVRALLPPTGIGDAFHFVAMFLLAVGVVGLPRFAEGSEPLRAHRTRRLRHSRNIGFSLGGGSHRDIYIGERGPLADRRSRGVCCQHGRVVGVRVL